MSSEESFCITRETPVSALNVSHGSWTRAGTVPHHLPLDISAPDVLDLSFRSLSSLLCMSSSVSRLDLCRLILRSHFPQPDLYASSPTQPDTPSLHPHLFT
ncbi:hypothetical protein V2G26_016158 [Clonostachys chloroleuca]